MQPFDAVTRRNAAIAYLVAWIAGLAVWPTNLGLDSTASAVASSHHEHAAQAVASYALTEGVAGLLLAVVVTGLTSRRAVRSGTVAAAISLLQCLLGFGIVAAAGHDVGLSGSLFGLVNRLDGVKMLLLAFAAASEVGIVAASAAGGGRPRPRWFRRLSLAAALALLVSAIAYLALLEPMAWTVFLSGPLLLGWVTVLGVGSRPVALDPGVPG